MGMSNNLRGNSTSSRSNMEKTIPAMLGVPMTRRLWSSLHSVHFRGDCLFVRNERRSARTMMLASNQHTSTLASDDLTERETLMRGQE